jgi:hypothetical protein
MPLSWRGCAAVGGAAAVVLGALAVGGTAQRRLLYRKNCEVSALHVSFLLGFHPRHGPLPSREVDVDVVDAPGAKFADLVRRNHRRMFWSVLSTSSAMAFDQDERARLERDVCDYCRMVPGDPAQEACRLRVYRDLDARLWRRRVVTAEVGVAAGTVALVAVALSDGRRPESRPAPPAPPLSA